MDVLLMTFDAPLMSFGAPTVDRHGVIQPYPALSMLTGMLGNALGYDHSQPQLLQRLQERLRYASRQDCRGEQLRDYQTVDLDRTHMRNDRAWTTRGVLEERRGGPASSGTHIRLRDYWAGAVHTVAVCLEPEEETPTVDDLAEALEFPARPLFIGRKSCLPAGPIYAGCVQVEELVDALRVAPLSVRAERRETFRAWWPTEPDATEAGPAADIRRPVTDARDWENQIHVSERWVAEEQLSVDERLGGSNG